MYVLLAFHRALSTVPHYPPSQASLVPSIILTAPSQLRPIILEPEADLRRLILVIPLLSAATTPFSSPVRRQSAAEPYLNIGPSIPSSTANTASLREIAGLNLGLPLRLVREKLALV